MLFSRPLPVTGLPNVYLEPEKAIEMIDVFQGERCTMWRLVA
jgi:hypothetical protein